MTLWDDGGSVPVMDPIETFNMMMQAMDESSHEEAREHAENLMAWIDRGGFPPLLRVSADDSKRFLASDDLAKAFSLAACSIAIIRAQQYDVPEPQ